MLVAQSATSTRTVRRHSRTLAHATGARQLVVDAQLPLAPRKHGEGLTFLGLATEDSSHCLTTRPARRQSGLSIDLSEQLPSTVAQVLEDDVATGVRTHGAILVRHKSRATAGGFAFRHVDAERMECFGSGVIPERWPT